MKYCFADEQAVRQWLTQYFKRPITESQFQEYLNDCISKSQPFLEKFKEQDEGLFMIYKNITIQNPMKEELMTHQEIDKLYHSNIDTFYHSDIYGFYEVRKESDEKVIFMDYRFFHESPNSSLDYKLANEELMKFYLSVRLGRKITEEEFQLFIENFVEMAKYIRETVEGDGKPFIKEGASIEQEIEDEYYELWVSYDVRFNEEGKSVVWIDIDYEYESVKKILELWMNSLPTNLI